MTNEEIVRALKQRLNEEGNAWNLSFEVSTRYKPDGEWTQFFVSSDANRTNSAAERQIISDVETDLIKEAGREILIIHSPEIIDAA